MTKSDRALNYQILFFSRILFNFNVKSNILMLELPINVRVELENILLKQTKHALDNIITRSHKLVELRNIEYIILVTLR